EQEAADSAADEDARGRRKADPRRRRAALSPVHHTFRRPAGHAPRLDEPRHRARGIPPRPDRALREAGRPGAGADAADLRKETVRLTADTTGTSSWASIV